MSRRAELDKIVTEPRREDSTASETIYLCGCGLMKATRLERCDGCGSTSSGSATKVQPARGESTMAEWCENEAKEINARGGQVVVKRERCLIWLERA